MRNDVAARIARLKGQHRGGRIAAAVVREMKHLGCFRLRKCLSFLRWGLVGGRDPSGVGESCRDDIFDRVVRPRYC